MHLFGRHLASDDGGPVAGDSRKPLVEAVAASGRLPTLILLLVLAGLGSIPLALIVPVERLEETRPADLQ